jgi:nucleotide-binding universal stress UspA family protein
MYDTVLVPTDGSDHAARAAAHGLALAEAFDATVHVINVVDLQATAGPFSAGGVDRPFVDRLEADGEAAIEEIEAAAGEWETNAISTAVVRGRPAGAILDYAADHDADLLTMGTHGRTGLNRYIAGSVTERVVRLAEIPVLTARATERSHVAGGYDEMLLPTDGSDYAAAAVEHGLAIAAQFDARVHAVTVVDSGDAVRGLQPPMPSGLLEALESAGEKATERVATDARDAGVDVVTDVREGSPAEELLAYAEDNGVGLIAMGTAGRTGVDRHLLGSTTERTIRQAEMPVLAVNAGKQVLE